MNNILHGPALDQLKTIESDSVDCCITSPPYWALRDYKTPGQLGLEPTFQEYITKLVEIFNEVKRVLKREGSCWVNIGDTYANNATAGNKVFGNPEFNKNRPSRELTLTPKKRVDDIPEKSLCLIPQRFVVAMVDQGWICRNTIIWYKPNCMPSSAKDRFTVDFEYLFFFTKTQKYYFETQYDPMCKPPERTHYRPKPQNNLTAYANSRMKRQIEDEMKNPDKLWGNGELGRIKRCVWKIPTQPFSEAHFAVFPPALVETPLKATCPEYVCKNCGKAREKIYQRALDYKASTPYGKYNTLDKQDNGYRAQANLKTMREITGIHEPYFLPKETGLTDCGCNAGFDGGIVLDPFFGSGTTGVVAMQNARNFIGIELSQAYIDMAMKRLSPYLLQTRLI